MRDTPDASSDSQQGNRPHAEHRSPQSTVSPRMSGRRRSDSGRPRRGAGPG